MSLWKSVQVFAASFFKERAAALASKAGLGQLWVKSDTPCTLQFTDDAGTDITLGSSNVEDSTAAGQLLFGDATGGYDHTETSEAVWDDTNKRVGIGTATPTTDIDITKSAQAELLVNSSGANAYVSIYGSGDNAGIRIKNNGAGVAHFGWIESSSLIAMGYGSSMSVNNSILINASGEIAGNISKKIPVSTATYALNESFDHPEIVLHVTRTAAGTCAITIDTDMLSQDSQITIKDAGGGAATYNITVQTEGAETIDGGATAVISGNYDSLTLYNEDSNWFIK